MKVKNLLSKFNSKAFGNENIKLLFAYGILNIDSMYFDSDSGNIVINISSCIVVGKQEYYKGY